MKKVTGLNDRLEHFEAIPQDAELMLPTVRQALIKQVAAGAAKPENPEDTITMYELGMKIKNTPLDFLEVEDADFKILYEAIKKNAAGYLTHFLGQLLVRAKAWEKGNDGSPQ